MFRKVGGDDVVARFTATGDAHGWPAATPTDNGTVYAARFTGGRNGLVSATRRTVDRTSVLARPTGVEHGDATIFVKVPIAPRPW